MRLTLGPLMAVLVGAVTLPSVLAAPSTASPSCRSGAPVRAYDVVALDVDITLNHFLDHDPDGRMFTLAEDVRRVREEEAANAAARAGTGDAAVTAGLQGDAIQPLILRVRPGECLRVKLRNELGRGEPVSLELHGATLRMAETGAPATATNPDAVARSGATVAYEWMVPTGEAEGTHYFHSHGDTRVQTGHGLFGAVIVEPAGSTWLDPLTGRELRSGWSAIIQDPAGPDFREFALTYHELGDESFQPRDRRDAPVPLVDPLTGAYRPAARALNYRSEPFGNRLGLQVERSPVGPGTFDESLAYSSYAFGDPATPILRSYLGEPAKQRVIHAGGEVFHVHHVHGGSLRWRRQPGVEPSAFASGLDKHPPLRPRASERTDSQSIGPSETYDAINECGSGGCQESAGDFLFHCHVAQHYFAGMWGLWRTYNTLQDGTSSTDTLPRLHALPDRAGSVVPAVASTQLDVPADGDLSRWVERQLPPRGQRRGHDAAVLDWQRDGDLYLGEPETDQPWPGYRPRAPGTRRPLLFDPRTGKLAYPFLAPHLGKRPPFAPNHGPAPFLDPVTDGPDPPEPGANGPGSVCPEGSRPKSFDLRAVTLPVPVNEKARLVDSAGMLFVLKEEEAAVRQDPRRRTPLAIRANAGEHCVDVLLTSQLEDRAESHFFSKVNAHIHFVQFDVQASDGVVAGFNYEQSVRPYRLEGIALSVPAVAGATTLQLAGGVERFQPGVVVGIGMDAGQTFEARTVSRVEGNRLVLEQPLAAGHGAGEIVSTEFVRYRWYNDAQFGTAYFHDHVNAIDTWRHGLYGALVAEPPGSTYHDPRTGEEILSGPVADIHTSAPVSADVTGSFRELVSFVHDDLPLTRLGRSTGSSLNLRAEPLAQRPGDPAAVFSSGVHGDPVTPLLEAYVGDPVVVRSLVGATNDTHTWHLDGHWFRAEPASLRSPPVSAVHLGISERYDVVVPAAGGPQRLPGDYVYGNGRSFKQAEGSWGILRVHPGADAPLRRLPGHETSPAPPSAVCPPGAPVRPFSVSAVDAPLPMLGGAPGKIYVLDRDREALQSGRRPPEPLVLHVGVGDCVRLTVTNRTEGGGVSFRCDLLAFDPAGSPAVAPGGTETFTYYASPEVGETVATVRGGGDPRAGTALGLYGAIVVGPSGSRYLDPETGRDVSAESAWRVDVVPPRAAPYRDFTLLLHDEDEGIGNHRMPYTTRVRGAAGINYRASPLDSRRGGADPAGVFSTAAGYPATPLMEASAGDPVRVHVLAPSSEQSQVFSIGGHRWEVEPGQRGTTLVSSAPLGGLQAMTLVLEGGAGGRDALAGDYLYGDHREPYREAGVWGLFRVHPPGKGKLRPLPGLGGVPANDFGAGPAVAAATLVLAGLVVPRLRSRSSRRTKPRPASSGSR